MPNITWSCREFGALANGDLYEILSLRAEIFVVEQDCTYQDLDGLDQQSLHLCGHDRNELVCYARITPPASRFPEPSIGRVLTRRNRRGDGLGEGLMRQAIEHCRSRWPDRPIMISAQRYLESFYRTLDFITVSESYLEDGIPHLKMRLG